MKIFYSGDKVDFKGTAVSLGNFDGLHIAHMHIIRSGMDYAKKNGLKSGVLLFDHHSSETTKTRNVALIMPNNYKVDILRQSGVDFVYFIKFDEEFMKRTPEEFVLFLKRKLMAECISVGYDYRFGYKARGDTELLRKIGKDNDIKILVAEKITLNNELVGSTYIRRFINNGEMEKASEYLGRHFFVMGFVVKGLQNGRKLGFPTANIDFEHKIILPPDGVYAGITYIRDVKYKSVINIGKNPTFGAQKRTLETHLLDFDGDIYDEHIKVEFISRLRGEIKFDNMEQLKKQILSDAEKTRKMNLY